jgi:tRNA-splicing ligase RtcB
MYKVSDKIITFLPPDTIEAEAMKQIHNTASMPFIFKHVAVMPDAHYGKGSTVGTVIATKGAIIPAAVGVDIGCGMIAVKTSLAEIDLKGALGENKLLKIREGIERRIPMSAGRFNKTMSESAKLRIAKLENTPGINTANAISGNWREQLGTLGGGNHFVEICLDKNNNIWVTLHSGSRGVGNRIGNFYINKAQKSCIDAKITLPDQNLAYLEEGTENFNNYIRDLHWAQEFALLNREEMMDRTMAELASRVINDHKLASKMEIKRINCHHNFTQIESHYGESVWITRKGAINASIGIDGMIPGSMGTKSYIVNGLANPESFSSAPHGAGRRFSRNKAREQFTMSDFDEAMKGIEHRRSEDLLDEIPQAYKNIEEVIENAKELIKVETTLKQILNCKGD